MAHCWARQPRARPSFPHLAGSCLHFVNWCVYHGSSLVLVLSWGGAASGRREGGPPTLQVEKVENLWEQLGNEKSDKSFYHTGKLGPRRNRGRRRAGEQVWQRAFKSRWGQRVDPRARSTRCLLQLPAMSTMSSRPKKMSHNKKNASLARTSYEYDVAAS